MRRGTLNPRRNKGLACWCMYKADTQTDVCREKVQEALSLAHLCWKRSLIHEQNEFGLNKITAE